MKKIKSNQSNKKEPEIDFTKFSPDDIAKKFLETPPKPKKKEKQDDTSDG